MSNSVKIAILGNCTTDYAGKELKNTSLSYGIDSEIYIAPFNQYVQEILNPNSGLYLGSPDVVIIWLEGTLLFPEWYDVNLLLNEKEEKIRLTENVKNTLVQLIETLRSNCTAKILVNNFKVPCFSPLGILDNKFIPGLKGMIASLNTQLEEWAAGKDGIFIFDYSNACAQYGLDKARDMKMYYAAKSPVSFPFMRFLAAEYMRYILPVKSKNKKCLVLDLDNTLWGGVAGEDGLEGVSLDITGPGMAFRDFQKAILNLYTKGILLAVNSKNNPEDALEIIENHPHMVLRKKHFSVMKINWANKVDNLKEIANELGIGLDSMVFIDDNPVERDLVRTFLPEVTVVEMPADTARYTETLEKLPVFELLTITEDDLRRNEMYQSMIKRKESLSTLGTMDEFLSGLGLEITVEAANTFTIPRISQLTLKTNQFNMTTKRYQSEDILKMADSKDYIVACCYVRDKFGDSGLSGVCIAKVDGTAAVIDTFVLSCRVLGMGIEYAFLNSIIDVLQKRGVASVEALFIKTRKNSANEDFYKNAGFSVSSAVDVTKAHILTMGDALNQKPYIRIVNKIGS